jgi:hypothetical protein
MKEQLITFETAKLAKEKGLNLTSFSDKKYYCENGKLYNVWYSANKGIYYIAITQSLLQKWLREKHFIHIYAYYSLSGYLYKLDSTRISEVSFNRYDTHEQALEKGLFEALKLIK